MDSEVKDLAVVEKQGVMSFSDMMNSGDTTVRTATNITDEKKLFNVETHVDKMLNDCVGEAIRVKEVLVKDYKKKLKDPIYDEETGEILKDYEKKMSIILIDDQGVSYTTGSKTFGYNLIKLLSLPNAEAKLKEGIDIKVIKVPVPNSGNKALSFELI